MGRVTVFRSGAVECIRHDPASWRDADAAQECLQVTIAGTALEVADDCAARSQVCDASGDDAVLMTES